MSEPQHTPASAQQGLTPLVQMFPMHIGEQAAAPARPGTNQGTPSPERTTNQPGQASNRAG